MAVQRKLLSSALVAIFFSLIALTSVQAADPLPSWNETRAWKTDWHQENHSRITVPCRWIVPRSLSESSGERSFFSHSGLAFIAVFPADFGAFIAAYMNILAGKKFYDFSEDILQKFKNFVISGTVYVLFNSPDGGYIKRASRTGKFGISS